MLQNKERSRALAFQLDRITLQGHSGPTRHDAIVGALPVARELNERRLIGDSRPGAMKLGGDVSEAEGSEMMRIALAMAFVSMPVLNEAGVAKQMARPDYIEYVCGIKGGQSKTYLNLYFARSDGAIQIRPGRCEDQQYSR
jgi:hypothetical protein